VTARAKLFRWRAIVPLSLFLALLVLAAFLLKDRVVKRAVERTGEYLVGAKVDLAAADVRLGEGAVSLRGLQVANPDAPMTNLVEADEIVLDLQVEPLLEKKLHIDTIAVRGVKFGTPRETSGALANPPEGSGRIRREIDAWASQIVVPPLSLEGLGRAIDVAAVQAESLHTIQEARHARALADSMLGSWDAQLTALDPRPKIDSARALVARLRAADPARLGVAGVTQLAGDARQTLQAVSGLKGQVAALDSTARLGVGQATAQLTALADAQSADVGRALGMLHLPSLEGPQLSPAIFGQAALVWIRPVLYWVRIAEQYLPPGLDPRRYSGPQRARASGTTVVFPGERATPRFLVNFAEAGLQVGGTGVAAGDYRARVTGLSSAPALTGVPMELLVGRSGAARGPTDARIFALLDHARAPIRDSLDVVLSGIGLPSLDLGPLGARLNLGAGTTSLRLQRTGDQIEARWQWRTPNATWERLSGAPTAVDSASIGTRAWAEALLWQAVADIRDVSIDVRLAGDIRRPSLGVSSNVGEVVAQSLRRAVGQQVARAEREVRAQVDALVADEVARANAGVTALGAAVTERIGPQLTELVDVESLLQEEIRRLTRRLPGGITLP
jgi:uncharacterized protein (TIGR03545 family)